MEKLQEVELKIDKAEDGVFAISLVENPAIQRDFVYLSEHEIKLAITSEEKREVIGLALVPNKRIYRKIEDKEFYIYFNEQTIKETAEKYMISLNLNNATVEHEKKVQDVSTVESWIVEDTKQDKSNIYKLDAPIGSWVVKMKINNDEVWQSIKDGRYKGFSIEGKYSGMEEILASEQKSLIDEVKEIIEKGLNG